MGTDGGQDRILYFDAFNGVSGDMILGGLLDLGLPLEYLRGRLAALPLEPYRLVARKIDRSGFSGTDFRVELENGGHSHGRTPGQIFGLIEESGLEEPVKEMASSVFRRLAEAEAAVHGESVEHIHFHEVGAVDAIVDIVGACIGFHYFGARRFFSSPLNLGSGAVTFSHGTWPVPAPATTHLVRGFPVVMGEVQAELTTPTGAAVVTTLAAPGAATPAWTLDRWGFGAGDRELPGIPNMLRLVLGREAVSGRHSATVAGGVGEEEVLVLEADIDDLDPEAIGYFMETALGAGALDVRCAPQQMKKGRPGHHLSVLCRPQDRDRMMGLIFRETTTLGIRWKPWRRWVLEREFREVETGHGTVRVKVGRFRGEAVTVWPEYEDLKRIAKRTRLPLKRLRQTAIRRATETERRA